MIREFYPHMPTAALAKVIGRSPRALKQRAQAMRVRKTMDYYRQFAGLAGSRFVKGQKPWNTGKHYAAGGRSPSTRFKPGNRPQTWRPIGHERWTTGYLQRKVTDTGYSPADYVEVHRLLWVEHNGPIPEKQVVCFRNGNPRDIRIENLELVSRVDLMRRNSVHTRLPPELVRLVQLRAALVRKIRARAKPRRKAA